MTDSKTKRSLPVPEKIKAPFGSWKSEITADMIAKGGVSFKDMVTEGNDIYWVESRPAEQGRYVVMHCSVDGKTKKEGHKIKECIPPGFSARSILYSYGGGALAVSEDSGDTEDSENTVYFSNYNPVHNSTTCDQRIFKQAPGKRPEPITPEVFMSYGDGIIDIIKGSDEESPKRRNRMICVKEDQTTLCEGYPIVSIVGIDLDGEKSEEVIVPGKSPDREQHKDNKKGIGFGFYSSPCLSPDGTKLAYLAWNFPRMPWDSNELWIADINDDGSPGDRRKIAGDTSKPEPGEAAVQKIAGIKGELSPEDLAKAQALFQPQWSPDGKYLYFVSDIDNWWHIYRYNISKGDVEKVTCNAPENSEFGLAQWYLGNSTYAFLQKEEKAEIKIAAAYNTKGEWHLAIIDPESKKEDENFKTVNVKLGIESDATEISHVRSTASGKAVFFAGCYNYPTSIVTCDPDTKKVEVLHMSMKEEEFKPIESYLSRPVSITYKTGRYMQLDEEAHAFFYYPKNPKYEIPEPKNEDEKKEKPPLLLLAHGGPTAATDTAFNLNLQYFTSRGIAVADVNYRGSTGFGREYRLSLYLEWGVYDRDDCMNCAIYLSTEKAVEEIAKIKGVENQEIKPIDIDRVLTRGGSAGGYLTLVLATYTDICKAGASYYGVSDLITLTEGTHKFEARYLDELLGPYERDKSGPYVGNKKRYMLRSPINVLDLLDTPLIFFQGSEDKVVPPEQSQRMFEAVKEKGLPVSYIEYPNEQHGFRIAKDIKDSLEQEFYFYSQMLDFEPADKPEKPVKIYNWTVK